MIGVRFGHLGSILWVGKTSVRWRQARRPLGVRQRRWTRNWRIWLSPIRRYVLGLACICGTYMTDFCALIALFGLPGYTFKGIEQALSKHRLTTLQAEIIFIRLRQAHEDFVNSTADTKAEIVVAWEKKLQQCGKGR